MNFLIFHLNINKKSRKAITPNNLAKILLQYHNSILLIKIHKKKILSNGIL